MLFMHEVNICLCQLLQASCKAAKAGSLSFITVPSQKYPDTFELGMYCIVRRICLQKSRAIFIQINLHNFSKLFSKTLPSFGLLRLQKFQFILFSTAQMSKPPPPTPPVFHTKKNFFYLVFVKLFAYVCEMF